MKKGIKQPHDNASKIRESLESIPVSPEIFNKKCQPVIDYVEELEGKIRLLQNQIFASKTEKKPAPENDGQMLLFNEAETESAVADKKEETIEVPSHTRVRPKRKPLPESLERVEIVHDIDESEKICGCGACLERIGEETSEKLDIIPAKARVIRHIRPKYACRKCEGTESTDGETVKIASVPAQIIPKGIPTEGLLSWIVVSKFCDSLPLYRQSKIFARIGVDISVSTLASWMVQVAERCRPIIELLRKEILYGPCINIDETTLQVLKEPGRSDQAKSYMWVFRGGPPESPSVIYQYSPTRSGSVAKDFVEGYSGYCQTDGYAGYDCLEKDQNIKLLGCFSHARRYFIKVIEARPKKDKGKAGSPEQAIAFIQKFYRIEREAAEKNLSVEEIFQLRQEKSKSVLDDFKDWLDKRSPQTPPSSLLGKAFNYTLSNWNRLIRYIENGNLKPDNNSAENAIRPFVVGRKNWLFSGHPNGAHASSVLYSLVESAKAAKLEPYAYLKLIFEKIPLAQNEEDYRALLPISVTSQIST
ncbi:IS66 family transposase [Desulforegula conservatrix]|uniref:IS66 family transposase n=1 Tax=Desulforegula conservatrix TaxID=153026 RepID=UPI00040D94E7|nr:IS66 family transposase [Desulforegula conservatrix]